MRKQEVGREHSSFASSRNAVSAFSFLGATEGVSALLVQCWRADWEIRSFFSYTLLKPSPVYCEAKEPFLRLL